MHSYSLPVEKVEVSMESNEIKVRILQSKDRELTAIKEKQMQDVIIQQEQKEQAQLQALLAVENYKLEQEEKED